MILLHMSDEIIFVFDSKKDFKCFLKTKNKPVLYKIYRINNKKIFNFHPILS